MKNLKQKALNKILVNGSFCYKPTSFKDVETDLFEGYKEFILELLETLPVFTTKQLGIKRPIDSFNAENIDIPILFILKDGYNKYLINTAGFNYCRYVIYIE
jgi:hypothetical protein